MDPFWAGFQRSGDLGSCRADETAANHRCRRAVLPQRVPGAELLVALGVRIRWNHPDLAGDRSHTLVGGLRVPAPSPDAELLLRRGHDLGGLVGPPFRAELLHFRHRHHRRVAGRQAPAPEGPDPGRDRPGKFRLQPDGLCHLHRPHPPLRLVPGRRSRVPG